MGKKKKRKKKRKNKGKKRTGAKKNAKKRRKEKAKKKKELCRLEKYKIVELIEVITHNGKEYSVQGPAKKPRKPPKTIQGNIKRKDKGVYKQYINLDDKVEKSKAHPEYGRCVRLKARIEWVDKKKKDSLAGKKVYWYSKADSGNKTGLTGNMKEGFDSTGGSLKKEVSTNDEKGWTPVVEFYLSQYGGDKFAVCATDDAAYKGGLKAETYEVWRKLWYQVTEMKDGKGGKFALSPTVTSALEAGYKSVFIVFEEKGARKSATYVGNPATDADLRKEAKKYFVKDSFCPFKCHIMTIDYGKQGSHVITVEDTMASKTWTDPDWKLLWRHGGGTFPWKVSAKDRLSSLFAPWVDIPDANLSVDTHPTQPGFKKVKISFSSVKAPLKIKLKLKVAGPSCCLGWGGGSHHIWLCSGMLRDIYTPGNRDLVQKSDCVHEIGHALGLVNMPPTKAHAHDAWEDTSSAKHCSKPPTNCAMYKHSSTTRLTTFHYDATNKNGCHDHLRRQDFSRSVMKNHWKD